MKRIMILGGTLEARRLADHAGAQGWCATLSLAGVTDATVVAKTTIPMRRGGFGGARGLADWITKNEITHLVDATHPYAARISASAAEAAAMTLITRLALLRPPWQPTAADNWREFDDWQSLAAALPCGARIFLTAGQDAIKAMADAAGHCTIIARALNNPVADNPAITFIASPPGKTVGDEKNLMRETEITHLVAKNSGGKASRAKIDAARDLGLPVFMLARPAPPPLPWYSNIDEMIEALS